MGHAGAGPLSGSSLAFGCCQLHLASASRPLKAHLPLAAPLLASEASSLKKLSPNCFCLGYLELPCSRSSLTCSCRVLGASSVWPLQVQTETRCPDLPALPLAQMVVVLPAESSVDLLLWRSLTPLDSKDCHSLLGYVPTCGHLPRPPRHPDLVDVDFGPHRPRAADDVNAAKWSHSHHPRLLCGSSGFAWTSHWVSHHPPRCAAGVAESDRTGSQAHQSPHVDAVVSAQRSPSCPHCSCVEGALVLPGRHPRTSWPRWPELCFARSDPSVEPPPLLAHLPMVAPVFAHCASPRTCRICRHLERPDG